jgi:hypothetical protein
MAGLERGPGGAEQAAEVGVRVYLAHSASPFWLRLRARAAAHLLRFPVIAPRGPITLECLEILIGLAVLEF